VSDRLCLLSVHAHPDDESSKGAGTVARYHADGVYTVLVTATGGEEGEILNPAMDSPEARANIHEIRMGELEKAISIIGYDELVLLGYRDSGMEDSEANAHPDSFAQADLDEAVGQLVAVIRRTRPQVIITYPHDQREYRHPDHLRVYDISAAAFDAAGDPEKYPGTGEPFQPLKMYYNGGVLDWLLQRHEKFLELGLESPYMNRIERWTRPRPDALEALTKIDLTGFEFVSRHALLAHATQIDPTSKHWFGLPVDAERTLRCVESFILARNLVGPIEPEDDLFAGVRELVLP
jgi:mycothiol S-conjugate amidase